MRVVRALVPPRPAGPAGPGALLAFAASALPNALGLAREVDVVHAHFTLPAGLIAWVLRSARGRPFLVTLPGSDVPGYSARPFSRLYSMSTPLVRAIWRRAARVVAVSDDLRQAAFRLEPTARFDVIPSGVDTRRFAPPAGVRREPGRILLVGRLIGLKGQAVFLRSLARVRKRWGGPLSVEIVGGGPDQEQLRGLASELGVSDVVHIHGFVPDEELTAHYARASLFVLPSVNDAAPLAILEAMASGLPVVASAVGGIPEVLAGNEKVLFPAGDESALAEAIVRMISDPSLSDSIGMRNRERALAFDWDRIARRYLDLYREVAAQAKSGAAVESGSGSQPPRAGQV